MMKAASVVGRVGTKRVVEISVKGSIFCFLFTAVGRKQSNVRVYLKDLNILTESY